MLDVLCSLFCFTPCLGRGALPLSQDCGGPMKPPGHGLFITKHLLMACGHRPVGSSPRPGEQCVPGLCLGFSLTHQVTMGKSLGFLAPLSPAVKFFWSDFPPTHLEDSRVLQSRVYGTPGAMEATSGSRCYIWDPALMS